MERRIKDTVLHELGHIVDGRLKSELKVKGNIYDYLKIELDKECYDTRDNWDNSLDGSFAEDFRIYFSEKLNKESYTPFKKRTIYKYNEEYMNKFFQSLLPLGA